MANAEPPRTVTISLDAGLAVQVDEAATREGRTRSEFFREAARQYLARRQRWERMFAYGEQVAARLEIGEEDVATIVRQRRTSIRRHA